MLYRFFGSHTELGNGTVLEKKGQTIELPAAEAEEYIRAGAPLEPVKADPPAPPPPLSPAKKGTE